MRFPGKKIAPENLTAFIKGYFQRGGTQVQFNMVDSEVLEEAKKSQRTIGTSSCGSAATRLTSSA